MMAEISYHRHYELMAEEDGMKRTTGDGHAAHGINVIVMVQAQPRAKLDTRDQLGRW